MTSEQRVYVPANDQVYEPTDDPRWWKAVTECDEHCHHYVHAFGRPQRMRHLEEASVIEAEGITPPPDTQSTPDEHMEVPR